MLHSNGSLIDDNREDTALQEKNDTNQSKHSPEIYPARSNASTRLMPQTEVVNSINRISWFTAKWKSWMPGRCLWSQQGSGYYRCWTEVCDSASTTALQHNRQRLPPHSFCCWLGIVFSILNLFPQLISKIYFYELDPQPRPQHSKLLLCATVRSVSTSIRICNWWLDDEGSQLKELQKQT